MEKRGFWQRRKWYQKSIILVLAIFLSIIIAVIALVSMVELNKPVHASTDNITISNNALPQRVDNSAPAVGKKIKGVSKLIIIRREAEPSD